MRSGQVEYQSKGLTLSSNLKLDISFWLKVMAIAYSIFESSTPSREYICFLWQAYV